MNEKERWEEIWKEEKNNLHTHPAKYLYILNSCNSKKILDIGCGDLSSLIYAKEKISLSYIVGIDIAENALRKAKEQIKKFELNADLVCADCDYLPFKNDSFELVMAMSLFPTLGESYLLAFKECYRVTKQNIGFNVTHVENAIIAKVRDMKEFEYGWIGKLRRKIFYSSEEKISALLKDFKVNGKIDVWYAISNHLHEMWKDDILVLAKKYYFKFLKNQEKSG
jgi:ubiquinone/menaquinone biosynthesis C-methylase UbiE